MTTQSLKKYKAVIFDLDNTDCLFTRSLPEKVSDFFKEGMITNGLTLVKSQPLDTGVLALYYQWA